MYSEFGSLVFTAAVLLTNGLTFLLWYCCVKGALEVCGHPGAPNGVNLGQALSWLVGLKIGCEIVKLGFIECLPWLRNRHLL